MYKCNSNVVYKVDNIWKNKNNEGMCPVSCGQITRKEYAEM